MSNLTILSIKYEEYEWLRTREDIERTELPVVYVDRNPKGVGSLSEAINRGMQEVKTPYVFIVTNINFAKHVPLNLLEAIEKNPEYAAICPTYKSDHAHLRPSSYLFGSELHEVPFIEFTAIIARTDVMNKFPLDEDMPYVGMDMDFSMRVKQDGLKLGVLRSVEIDHTYNRHLPKEHITRVRTKWRKQADAKTIEKLVEKYGHDWPDRVGYHAGIATK